MKSEVERAAGSALLRDYGNFFKRQQIDLFTANNSTPIPKGGGIIRVEYSTHEAVSALELAQSDNPILTKIICVFSTLCIEVDELKREAYETHFPALAVCGVRDPETGCDAKETAVICRVAAFAQRCQHTLLSLCSQLVKLYTTKLINLQGIQIHYIISKLSEVGALLTELEALVADGDLPRRWTTTVAAVRLFQHTRNSKKTNAIADAAKDLHDRLMSDHLFQDALDSLLPLKKTIAKGCGSLPSEFSNYLKLALARLDKATDDVHTPDLLHKCVKVNVLFVLNVRLFGGNDKKIFKSLIDLNTKAPSVPLSGRAVWFPEPFLARHVPARTSGALGGIARARHAKMAAGRAAGREAALQAAATAWVLSMESAFQETDAEMNATQINEYAQLLLRGLELAGEIKNFVVSTVSVHRAVGSPLPRSQLLVVLRAACVLQSISASLSRNRASAVRASHAVVQHVTYRVVAAIVSLKKNLAGKKDEMTCALIAERASRGAVTRARNVVASVALSFLPAPAVPEVADGRVASLLNKITTLADFNNSMERLCDGSWIFWHSDIIPTFFYQKFVMKSEALQLRNIFAMLEDCGTMLRKVEEDLGGNDSEKFATEVKQLMEESIVKPTSQIIETDLRLHLHSHLRQDDADPFTGDGIKLSLLVCGDFRHLQTHMSLTAGIENYLSTVYYNLTTLVLSDRRTYSEMRQMAKFKFQLQLVDDELPTQTLEQGLDVLEIMRNIDVFVSRYLYNLNNQMFIEHKSDSKHLNTISIRHVANSIRAHGTGVMNTTVNFTYQFLKNKFFTFSQFMFDEHIKSRLAKDRKMSRDSMSRGEPPYVFRSADKFNKGIRNLGIVDEGQSYLDLFRGLISQIGNAMGYVRMVRSGGRHCCAGATVFLPSLDETTSFKQLCEQDGLSAATQAAAENLDNNIHILVNNFTGGTEYFKLLVDVFAPVFRSPKNVHLKNFFMIVPPLTLNFVENLILAKDKMTKNDKAGAAFTDDGFAMGLAYILKLLDQDAELDSLHWFEAVWTHVADERESLQQQKAAGNEQLQRALALTERKIAVLEQEFRLLYYSFSSARIFFQ